MKMRVAHFLLLPELAHSPPNDALVRAWLDLGFAVDLFHPGPAVDVSRYGPDVRSLRAEYGYRWLASCGLDLRWRHYRAFSGTTEDPMAIAGNLGRLWRRRVITLADEIRSGSYSGNRSAAWKAWCRFGMRASALTIVNEAERVALQRDYAGLSPAQEVIVYPGAFKETPPAADRAQVRAARGIPVDALLLCYSGTYSYGNGGLWLAQAIADMPQLHAWGQVLTPDPLVRGLLQHMAGADRLHLESARLGWQDAWSVTAAADIGMVVYLQDGPQWQHMGIASNRLCMFLSMGVPVIASRQPSFQFIEDHDCGVLVDGPDDMPAAIGRIASRLSAMRANALACARTYVAAEQRWNELRAALRRTVAS